MRTDPDEARGCDGASERGIFGQEAVAGMHRLCARALRDVDEFGEIEIAQRGRSRSDKVGLVRHTNVQRVAIGFGIDRDGRDAHFAGRADHAHRDLAAVGDDDFGEHR